MKETERKEVYFPPWHTQEERLLYLAQQASDIGAAGFEIFDIVFREAHDASDAIELFLRPRGTKQ